ncbi:MAG: fused MFS/spermidine synthase [Coriobacteriia bacterium]|nr:fused MFS/spermidine synthase [Coriobacteriia bacterium]
MYEHISPFHRLAVTDNNGVRLLKFERNQQSSMRLDDPFDTDIEYVAYFHIALAIQPAATRVLVLGLGGGTVVKRMWRDYPEMRIDAVEIDAEVAFELFELPRDERIAVFVGDGREYVRTTIETYDIIIVDAFDDDHVPPHLLTEEFLRELRDRLAEKGVVAFNLIGSVHGEHSKPFRSFHRTISNVWRNVWMFPVGLWANGPIQLAYGCNIVLFASDVELSAEELLVRIAKRVDGRVSVKSFALLGKDLYQGQIRSGDVGLLLDPPSRRR